MNNDFKITTPVLFIVFNRPQYALQVFSRIRRARPTKLFIIADGPRANKPGEMGKVQQCRAIKDMVDWECEVKTNFSDVNMGCKNRIVSGINWAFEQTEELIILEDDCVPDLSFFRFCQELLEKYRNDNRVLSITGSNHDWTEHFDESYIFSKSGGSWGWATWKRAWTLYDVNMKLWPHFKANGYLKHIFEGQELINNEHLYQQTYEGKIDTWDYQYAFCNFVQHGLGIKPKINMIRNIGFEAGGAHTEMPTIDHLYMDEETKFPLIHPSIMAPLDRRGGGVLH